MQEKLEKLSWLCFHFIVKITSFLYNENIHEGTRPIKYVHHTFGSVHEGRPIFLRFFEIPTYLRPTCVLYSM
jgi:hypothetical protein